jgi:hypothetical protein
MPLGFLLLLLLLRIQYIQRALKAAATVMFKKLHVECGGCGGAQTGHIIIH